MGVVFIPQLAPESGNIIWGPVQTSNPSVDTEPGATAPVAPLQAKPLAVAWMGGSSAQNPRGCELPGPWGHLWNQGGQLCLQSSSFACGAHPTLF